MVWSQLELAAQYAIYTNLSQRYKQKKVRKLLCLTSEEEKAIRRATIERNRYPSTIKEIEDHAEAQSTEVAGITDIEELIKVLPYIAFASRYDNLSGVGLQRANRFLDEKNLESIWMGHWIADPELDGHFARGIISLDSLSSFQNRATQQMTHHSRKRRRSSSTSTIEPRKELQDHHSEQRITPPETPARSVSAEQDTEKHEVRLEICDDGQAILTQSDDGFRTYWKHGGRPSHATTNTRDAYVDPQDILLHEEDSDEFRSMKTPHC